MLLDTTTLISILVMVVFIIKLFNLVLKTNSVGSLPTAGRSNLQKRSTKMDPRNAKVHPRSAKVRSRSAKMHPRSDKMHPRSDKMYPRSAKVHSRSAKVHPRSAKMQHFHFRNFKYTPTPFSHRRIYVPHRQPQSRQQPGWVQSFVSPLPWISEVTFENFTLASLSALLISRLNNIVRLFFPMQYR